MSQTHRHLISGYFFRYGQGAVLWSSKKQSIVTLLSTEAEYMAKMHMAKEAIWLRLFINEVKREDDRPLTTSVITREQ